MNRDEVNDELRERIETRMKAYQSLLRARVSLVLSGDERVRAERQADLLAAALACENRAARRKRGERGHRYGIGKLAPTLKTRRAR